MHIVEVRRVGRDLAGPMGRMRSWLDDHQILPRLFQLRRVVFHLEFEAEAEAIAFAGAFDGRVIGTSNARAA
jgi:hypothetical protein